MANEQGKEVIIHMCMASQKRFLNDGESEYLLSTETDKNATKKHITRATLNISHALGMNNPIISVVTIHPDIILPQVKMLKDKNLYIIDSITFPLSIVYENCLIYNVLIARRIVFLDNNKNVIDIDKQLCNAIGLV